MDNTNNTIFPHNISLPNKVFDEKIHYFLAFEPSFVSDEAFYPCLSKFSSKVDGNALISIEVLDDNDLKCLSDISRIENDIQFRENWDNIFNSDCKCIYSQMIGLYSESLSWGVYVDNVDFEIGLVGFDSEEHMNLFLEIFSPELDVFQSLKDYVEETDSILDFSPKTRKLYDAIVRNHSNMIEREWQFLPKDLAEIFESLEYEEDGYLKVRSIKFVDNDILFEFSISWNDTNKQRQVRCWVAKIRGYKDFSLDFSNSGYYLKFYTDHIVLQQYKEPVCELYFKRKGNNPELLYTEIKELHSSSFGSFISEKYINADLLMLCKAESGLFARGPKNILDYYYNCLLKAGKEPYFYDLMINKSLSKSININSYKLMTLGSIYFIGEDFIFEEVR